jgi:hypothetical protein
MRIHVLLVLLFSLTQAVVRVNGQTTSDHQLHGVVLNAADSLPIAGAHVINLTTLKGVVSSEKGAFSLIAKPTDRVLVSYIGFDLDTLQNMELVKETGNTLRVYLTPTSYLLPIFQVLSIQTFDEFERAFLALQLPEKTIQLNLPLPGSYQSGPPNMGAAMIAIPMDFSYFSKKSVELRKYKRLLDEDESKKMVYARYNPQVVELVTGLRDEKRIHDLMQYCDFSDQFIREAIDYDLYVAIVGCYQTYQEKD